MLQNLNSNGVRDTNLTVWYTSESRTEFEVDGDLIRQLWIKGKRDYVKHWLRDKLRKLENGEIKVYSSDKRDWEQEERIKRQLWEDINVNEVPVGFGYQGIIYTVVDTSRPIICYTYEERVEIPPRSPSPCRIS